MQIYFGIIESDTFQFDIIGERVDGADVNFHFSRIEERICLMVLNIEIPEDQMIEQVYTDVTDTDFGVELVAQPCGCFMGHSILHGRNTQQEKNDQEQPQYGYCKDGDDPPENGKNAPICKQLLHLRLRGVNFTVLNYKTSMPVTILGIESSCDETAAAVISDGKLLSNIIAAQSVHAEYGGVVPELASRAHLANIVPVVSVAMRDAGKSLEELDAIAFTQGPGLLGALMVGASYAKGVALALDIPLVPVHHMRAHILAHFIEDPKPEFPFLCLTVSGGHTQIVRVESPTQMHILGQTLDDAAGEAFDKCAKMMGLPYPGGPLIDKYAETGDPLRFTFAEPKIPGLDFSFSGFKTSVLYFLKERSANDPLFIQENLHDLSAAVQHNIVEILLRKVKRAARETGIHRIALAGGVSVNSGLRSALRNMAVEEEWEVFIPNPAFCTDNAAMIAMAGYFQFLEGTFADQTVIPLARMPEL